MAQLDSLFFHYHFCCYLICYISYYQFSESNNNNQNSNVCFYIQIIFTLINNFYVQNLFQNSNLNFQIK
jgi:hypothetical protein